MNIEECLKNNKTYNIFSKGAIQKVQKMIENNEDVLYALASNVSIFEKNSISFTSIWWSYAIKKRFKWGCCYNW